jgi:putative peptidoglycan lipid II flippase
VSGVPAPADGARPLASRVGVAALVWSSAILFSRVVGLVRDIVIGRTLRVSGEADVYSSAFRVPDFVNYLLAGGLLSLTFIPIFSRHLRAGQERRGWESFSDIANFLLLVALPLTLLIGAAMPWIAPIVADGFDAAKQQRLVELTRIILPAQLFLMLGAMLSGTLQARDRHAVAAFAPSAYTVGIIVVGLALYGRLGAEAFAWGVLAGAALGAFAIPLVACARGGMRWSARLDLGNPDFRGYIRLALPVMIGQSIVVLDSILWTWQGSHLAEGTVSSLTYANRLLNVPAGIFGLAAGAGAYPTLVRLHDEKRPGEAYALLTQAAKTTLLLALLSQAMLTVVGEDAVRAVWGFDDAHAEAIGLYVSVFAVALGAWSLHPLLSRGFYARGDTWTPTLIGTGVTILVVPLYVAARHAWGAAGLAAASSTALVLYVVPLHLALRRAVRRELGADAVLPRWRGFLLRALLALGLTLAALVGVRELLLLVLPGRATLACLARIAAVSVTGIPVFLVVARMLGIEEGRALAERCLRGLAAVGARVRSQEADRGGRAP